MTHKVQFAASKIVDSSGLQAFHTSVLVDGEEFSFSDSGINRARGPASHQATDTACHMVDMGTSTHSGDHLFASLECQFEPKTYDKRRKNRNTFSDSALFCLLKVRLNPEYFNSEYSAANTPGEGIDFSNVQMDAFALNRPLRDIDSKNGAKAVECAAMIDPCFGAHASRREMRISRTPGTTSVSSVGSRMPSEDPPLPPPPFTPPLVSFASISSYPSVGYASRRAGEPQKSRIEGAGTLVEVWNALLGWNPGLQQGDDDSKRDSGGEMSVAWPVFHGFLNAVVQVNSEWQNSCGCPAAGSSPRARDRMEKNFSGN